MSFHLIYSKNGKAHDLILQESKDNILPKNGINLNGRDYIVLGTSAEEYLEAEFLIKRIKEISLNKEVNSESFRTNLIEWGVEDSTLKCSLLKTTEKVDKVISTSFPIPEQAQELPHFEGTQKVENLVSPSIYSSKIESVKVYLKEAVENQHFSGTVMIAEGDRVLLSEAYGMASKKEQNTPQTIFHVGSVTKQFTAAAILQLKEAGKIDLHNTSINRYLPEEYCDDVWENVTVNHLLTHTGGIADYEEWRSWKDEKKGFGFCFDEEAAMIRTSQKRGLQFKEGPGSKMAYTNMGYTLLGCIITKVAEISYGDYVQKHILIPLEMNSSFIHPKGYSEQAGHAAGYRWDKEENKLVDDDKPELAVTAPDGGLCTTTRDLHKWTQTLTGKKKGVLSEESRQLMLTPTEVSKPRGYGCGIGIDDSTGSQRICHNGGIPGFRAMLTVYPEKDLHLFFLCNNTEASPEDISQEVEKILFSKN